MKKFFGLIGYPLGHSFSQKYFTEKFAREEVNASYENIELRTLDGVRNHIAKFSGVNVTIPHKQHILSYLDVLSPEAEAIGAVNVLSREGELWKGYNTDQFGFEKSLLEWLPKELPKQALVFGNGGAAAAVKYTLKKLEISYFSVSRNPEQPKELSYKDVSCELLKNSLLLINTTPLGMHPNTDACVEFDYECLTNAHFCYDLIYNPEETAFMKEAKKNGAQTKNGLSMLHLQAEKAWQIWNSSNIDANSSL